MKRVARYCAALLAGVAVAALAIAALLIASAQVAPIHCPTDGDCPLAP